MLYATECEEFQLRVLINRTAGMFMAMLVNTCDMSDGFFELRATVEDVARILAKNLRALMERANLQQVDVAGRLGVSKSTVNGWLSTRSTPNLGQLPAIASLFGISVSALLNPSLIPDEGVEISVEEALKILAEAHGKETRTKRIRRKKP